MPTAAPQAPGKVSFLVLLASIFLLLVGVLTAIAGGILFLGGNVLGQVGTAETGSGVFGAIGGFIAGIAVVVIVWALIEVFGAFGMLFRRTWGRVIGFMVGIIGAIFTGFGLLAAAGSLGNSDGTSAGAGVVVVLVVFLGYVLTVVALVRGGGHFRHG